MHSLNYAAALGLFSLCSLTVIGEAGSKPSSMPKDIPAVVAPLMTKVLPDLPGKEGQMLLVEYPPGSADPVHRHDADAFVYVLEGSIVMQVRGGKEVVLTAGQTFYEGPGDVHVIGKNASDSVRARFVVVLIKNQGAPALLPIH